MSGDESSRAAERMQAGLVRTSSKQGRFGWQPREGTTMATRWFVVSQARPREDDAPHDRSPWTMHAKELGTLLTVCGQPCTTWFTDFTASFPVTKGNNCPVCLWTVLAAKPSAR
jgi:hypothetical protein